MNKDFLNKLILEHRNNIIAKDGYRDKLSEKQLIMVDLKDEQAIENIVKSRNISRWRIIHVLSNCLDSL